MAADGRVEEEEEGPEAPPPPPPENFYQRWHRRTETFLNTLVSESALKVHLLVYWLFVLGQLLGPRDESHSPWLLLLVLIAGIAVVCAMMGTASQSPGFLYPIIFVALFETARFALYSLNMVALTSNIQLLPDGWMLFQPMGDGRDLILVCLYAVLSTYFFMMALTAGALFMSYRELMIQRAQLQLRMAAMRNDLVRQLQQTGAYLVANGGEPVDRNVDSPPHYSAVILEAPEAVITAKEETSPPRYSQIDPLMFQGSKSESSVSSKV